MKVSYAADSSGNIIAVHNDIKPLKNINLKLRLSEMQSLLNEIILLFGNKGINISEKTFDFMIQPLYTEDCLLFFTRTMLSSSSDEVKLSNSLKNKPDFVFRSSDEEDRLKSIFSTEENGKTVWWLLSAERVIVERNLYDGKPIGIKAGAPIPYHWFTKNINKIAVGQSDIEKTFFCNKYRFFGNSERNYFNVSEIMKTSIVRSFDFDNKVEHIIGQIKETNNLSDKDVFSNRKNLCLWLINDRKTDNIFEDYSEIKLYLKKNYPMTVGIHYKDNAIIFGMDIYGKQTVYVCSSFDNSDRHLYIIGGHIFFNIDELKNAIAKTDCFTQKKWYAEKVIPYIIKEAKTEKVNKSKDEIGWYKRRKSGKE